MCRSRVEEAVSVAPERIGWRAAGRLAESTSGDLMARRLIVQGKEYFDG